MSEVILYTENTIITFNPNPKHDNTTDIICFNNIGINRILNIFRLILLTNFVSSIIDLSILLKWLYNVSLATGIITNEVIINGVNSSPINKSNIKTKLAIGTLLIKAMIGANSFRTYMYL